MTVFDSAATSAAGDYVHLVGSCQGQEPIGPAGTCLAQGLRTATILVEHHAVELVVSPASRLGVLLDEDYIASLLYELAGYVKADHAGTNNYYFHRRGVYRDNLV
ncbi:hypothetical protein MASR2M48_10800 [Spirochaetota bacterium]